MPENLMCVKVFIYFVTYKTQNVFELLLFEMEDVKCNSVKFPWNLRQQ